MSRAIGRHSFASSISTGRPYAQCPRVTANDGAADTCVVSELLRLRLLLSLPLSRCRRGVMDGR